MYRELGTAKRLDPLTNADGRCQQELVVCATINDIVEFEIEGPVALFVTAANCFLGTSVDKLEADALRWGHTLRGKASARRLQLAHDLEHLGKRRVGRK